MKEKAFISHVNFRRCQAVTRLSVSGRCNTAARNMSRLVGHRERGGRKALKAALKSCVSVYKTSANTIRPTSAPLLSS